MGEVSEEEYMRQLCDRCDDWNQRLTEMVGFDDLVTDAECLEQAAVEEITRLRAKVAELTGDLRHTGGNLAPVRPDIHEAMRRRMAAAEGTDTMRERWSLRRSTACIW